MQWRMAAAAATGPNDACRRRERRCDGSRDVALAMEIAFRKRYARWMMLMRMASVGEMMDDGDAIADGGGWSRSGRIDSCATERDDAVASGSEAVRSLWWHTKRSMLNSVVDMGLVAERSASIAPFGTIAAALALAVAPLSAGRQLAASLRNGSTDADGHVDDDVADAAKLLAIRTALAARRIDAWMMEPAPIRHEHLYGLRPRQQRLGLYAHWRSSRCALATKTNEDNND